MGRHNDDSTVVHSSIALLQERFRQLQRVREMREEKLTRAFAEAEGDVGNGTVMDARCDQPTWFFHPELIRPSRPLRVAPSIQLKPRDDCMDLQAFDDTSLSIALWPNRPIKLAPNSFNDTDVDTTLHL